MVTKESRERSSESKKVGLSRLTGHNAPEIRKRGEQKKLRFRKYVVVDRFNKKGKTLSKFTSPGTTTFRLN